ncbi:MAG TPA: hypothetical protein VIN08_25765 [Ohtaekwangia sp.]|uniref:hypothetical protein n=1 Tax=Ohtaekwangia sp. TaxID=2066019 RepID=UPI002F92B373
MAILAKQNKKDKFTDQELKKLQTFVKKLEKGEVAPFKDKIDRARKNLKKAGLIK